MNANICRFLLSANFPFSPPLNLWSFKTAGRQTASCLKFMKHLFNSPGWDPSWQPFTFPYLNTASLTFVRPALDVMCAPWQITFPHHSRRPRGCFDQRGQPLALATSRLLNTEASDVLEVTDKMWLRTTSKQGCHDTPSPIKCVDDNCYKYFHVPKVRGIISFPEPLEEPKMAKKSTFCKKDNRHEWLLNTVGIKPALTSLHLVIKANLLTLFLSPFAKRYICPFPNKVWRSFQSCCALPGEYDLSANTLPIELQMSG